MLVALDWKQPSENFNTISLQFFLECKSRISPPLIQLIQCLQWHHHWRRLPRKCPHWSEPIIREEGCSLEQWNVPWEDVDWPDELCCLAAIHCSKSSRPCSPVWTPKVCLLVPIPHWLGAKRGKVKTSLSLHSAVIISDQQSKTILKDSRTVKYIIYHITPYHPAKAVPGTIWTCRESRTGHKQRSARLRQEAPEVIIIQDRVGHVFDIMST